MQITRIEVEEEDVLFWFADSDEIWTVREFTPGTTIREFLNEIEVLIRDFNAFTDEAQNGVSPLA